MRVAMRMEDLEVSPCCCIMPALFTNPAFLQQLCHLAVVKVLSNVSEQINSGQPNWIAISARCCGHQLLRLVKSNSDSSDVKTGLKISIGSCM